MVLLAALCFLTSNIGVMENNKNKNNNNYESIVFVVVSGWMGF